MFRDQLYDSWFKIKWRYKFKESIPNYWWSNLFRVNLNKISILIIYYRDKKREKEVPILEILQDIMSSRRNSSKCELKNRSDVVNKSILRAIKRHLAKAFKSYHPYRRFKVLRNKLNHFEKSLREMSDVYMHQYQANDVYNIFGYLINPEIFSQTLNYEKSSYPEIKEFAEVFQDWWIHYSHTKYEYVKQ